MFPVSRHAYLRDGFMDSAASISDPSSIASPVNACSGPVIVTFTLGLRLKSTATGTEADFSSFGLTATFFDSTPKPDASAVIVYAPGGTSSNRASPESPVVSGDRDDIRTVAFATGIDPDLTRAATMLRMGSRVTG